MLLQAILTGTNGCRKGNIIHQDSQLQIVVKHLQGIAPAASHSIQGRIENDNRSFDAMGIQLVEEV